MTDTTLRARVALRELEAMGLTVEDLLAADGRQAPPHPGVKTVAEYVPIVAAGYKPRSQRTDGSYWRLLVELCGERPLDRVTVDELMEVADEAARRAWARRAGSDGRASRESCVTAMRAVFTRATKAATSRPTRRSTSTSRDASRTDTAGSPRRNWTTSGPRSQPPPATPTWTSCSSASTSRAVPGEWGPSTCDCWTSTTVARRSGCGRSSATSANSRSAAASSTLCPPSPPPDPRTPCSASRPEGAGGCRPLSDRRYDRLFERVQEHVEWSASTPLTAHVLHHTTVTAVERLFGTAVAAAFAGHTSTKDTTAVYTTASITEVATAVATLTGEPHPLAEAR